MNKHALGIQIALFLVIAFLITTQPTIFGFGASPIVFFLALMGLGIFTLYTGIHRTNTRIDTRAFSPIMGFGLGVFSIAVAYEEIRKLFDVEISPLMSDVIFTIDTMVDRVLSNQIPYSTIEMKGYTIQPPYMPMHFLPFVGKVFLPDMRWVWFIVLGVAVGIWGLKLAKLSLSKLALVMGIVLPSVILWMNILGHKANITLNVEWIIYAYYLLLGASLLTENTTFRGSMIGICLLSRFTLLFWIPFYLWWVYKKESGRNALKIVGWIGVWVLCVYVIPFLSRDIHCFERGLAYHGKLVYNFWNASDPEFLNKGIQLGYWIKHGLAVSNNSQLLIIQLLNLLLPIFTLGILEGIYQKRQRNIPLPFFALISLQLYLTVFYFLLPWSFNYYLLPLWAIIIVTMFAAKLHPKSDNV